MRVVHRVVLTSPTGTPPFQDVKNTTVVVGQLNSNHTDPLAVYLAFKAPGADLVNDPNGPGDCSVSVVGALPGELANQVFNWTRIAGPAGTDFVSLLPGQKITLSTNVVFQCDNPGAVVGQTWTVKAIADVHGDPLAPASDYDGDDCDTLTETFGGLCNAALLDDDNGADPNNNTKTRDLPKVAT